MTVIFLLLPLEIFIFCLIEMVMSTAQSTLNHASWIQNATNAWRVRPKYCIFSDVKIILYPMYEKAITKFASTFWISEAPSAIYVPSSGGTSIDFLSIYEDHNLPSVVTRHLACITIQPIRYILIHWRACLSRPVTRDSLLKRHKSRHEWLVVICDEFVTRELRPLQSRESRVTGHGSRAANPPVVTRD